MLTVLFLVLSIASILHAQTCPGSVPDFLRNQVFTLNYGATSTVQYSICDTLPFGCFTTGGGQICTVPGCCSVCQQWNIDQPNQGAACLGLFSGYLYSGGNLILNYTGGDPVPPPGPPSPGPRTAYAVISPGNKNNTLYNLKFVDHNQNHKPGDPYVWEIDAEGPINQCQDHSSCSECTKDTGCSWCYSSSTCLNSIYLTASSCTTWAKDSAFCGDPCSAFTNCKDCTSATCSWCHPSKTCSSNINYNCKYNINEPVYCFQ